ncbi:MAG: DUF2723 domain-containing protein [Pirellulales bacterium]|nr:DUF2723 domain-containing protein [Pirellulales bacterium]
MQSETHGAAETVGVARRDRARTTAGWWLVAMLALLAGLTFASRWWLRSQYLLTWDTVQSAAAISHYDVALHMPHPPGEPVYVLLLKLVRPLAASPAQTVLLVACAADGLAVVLVFLAASRAVSRRVGAVAAAVFFVSPLAWHSATLGMTFGLDVCASAAIGLTVLGLIRRPGDAKGVLLAVLFALALGIRCNVNWAGVAMGPLAVYGLWRVRPLGKAKAALAFAVVLAAWAIPLFLRGASQPGYLAALTDHFAATSWQPSALGTLCRGDVVGAVRALVASMVEYAAAVAPSLGAVALLLPIVLIPLPRRHRDSIESTPWRFLLTWLLPTVLLMAAGTYHAEEYAAVAVPGLTILAAMGILRAALWMRLAIARFGVPRPAGGGDRLEQTFAVTHVLVFCALNVFLFTVLMWKDPNGSRILGGRRVTSTRAQIGHADHPRELLAPSVRTIARYCRDRQGLIIANFRLEFLVYALYVPDQTCLYVCRRDGVPVAVLARNYQFEFREIGPGKEVPMPEAVDLVFAARQLGDEAFRVIEPLRQVSLAPHDERILAGMNAYRSAPGRLRLRHRDGVYLLEPADQPKPRAARLAHGRGGSAPTGGTR